MTTFELGNTAMASKNIAPLPARHWYTSSDRTELATGGWRCMKCPMRWQGVVHFSSVLGQENVLTK